MNVKLIQTFIIMKYLRKVLITNRKQIDDRFETNKNLR